MSNSKSAAQLKAELKLLKGYVETADVPRDHEFVSLGPLSLNTAAGDVRGVKSGRLIQIFGKESSGKSTLALDIIAQFQKTGRGPALYIDFERSFDAIYAETCGVDLAELLLARVDHMQRGFDIIYSCIESGIKLIVIDSIAAAMPKSEADKSAEDAPKMASAAGPITQFVNKVIPMLDDNDVLLVCINQLRANFNQMSPEKEIPFGGHALQYHTALKLHVTKIKTEATKQTTQVVVKKNKTNAPQGRAEFFINYGEGVDHKADILTIGEERGILVRKGAWYNYGELKAQGMDNAKETFPVNEIRHRILTGK